MSHDLSPAEREEIVTKGYLHDLLNTTLEERDYVTKDYLQDAFDAFEQKMYGYMQAFMEDNRAQTLMLIEAFEARFQRLERAVFPEGALA